jgi:hypothetical protein
MEIASIIHDAEKAALQQALGGRTLPNPHPRGTRANILWEAHRGAVLVDWED